MDEAESLRSLWKREKTGKKAERLTFYRETTQKLEEVTEKYSNGKLRCKIYRKMSEGFNLFHLYTVIQITDCLKLRSLTVTKRQY